MSNENANLTKVIVPCRFSYLHCWEPNAVSDGDPKYSVSAIIPKSDTETIEKIKRAIEQAKKDSVEYYPPWEPPVSRFRAIRKWYFPPSEPPQHIVAAHIFDFTINLLIVILGELLMQYHQIIYREVFLCLRRQKSEVFWNFWEKI